MVQTVEESLDGFRRFTAELLQIKETQVDPFRAVEAVKDWSHRFESDGIWPILDHGKRDLVHAVHEKFKESDVWTKFCEAQGAVADWLYQLLGSRKFNAWTIIRSEKEWALYVIAAASAQQWHNLMDFHKEAYDGPLPAKYPCLARAERRSCDTWPAWWEADFVYEDDARALLAHESEQG